MMIFVDSFGHYTLPFLDKKWDVVGSPDGSTTATLNQGITLGRFGGGGVVFASGNDVSSPRAAGTQVKQYIQKNYSGVSVIVVGLAILQTTTQLARGSRLLTFLDSATTQVGIDIMPSGQLRAVRASAAGTGIFLVSTDATVDESGLYTELGTSTDSISSSSYDFLEFKITFATGTGGIIEVKRNGAAFWTLNNVNTAISGVANSSSLLVGGYAGLIGGTGLNVENHFLRATISDFYLLNTTAGGTGDPVDFIGDRHWEPLFPLSDATYTEWTPDPVGDHFANIDEVPPDDGATNNNTDTLNDRDSFDFESALGPAGATVIFSYTMYTEKDTGGAVEMKGLSRSGGIDGLGTAFQVPNPYAFRQSFGFIDPNTSAAWTVANFNAAEHGYKRTA